MELRLASEQVIEHGLTRLAEVLGDAIQELRMPDFVLDLRREGELPAKRRRPHDPLALGEHAHQLRVGVHFDEPEHRGPVLVRHPVVGLDLAAGANVGLEQLESFVVRQVIVPGAGTWVRRREEGLEGVGIGHRSAP